MSDYEVLVVGAGPAGLAAGLRLTLAGRRVLVLERESLGGALPKFDRIDDYPGICEGVSGAELSAALVAQAQRSGLQIQLAEVSGVEMFSSSQWVACADGSGYTTRLIIAATGLRPKALGVEGKRELRPFVLVAGDVRHDSSQTVASAVGDGTNAACRALELLSARDGSA